MSAGFTKAQVEQVAALAHLELTPDEVDLFARQLGDILAYAEQVQRIDTSNVPPTASVATAQADRDDVPAPSLDRDAALGNAPDANSEAGLFKVPRVIG
jgi:aspartyl-tRNA(Asn)/glutamyl-tRNA(Gln) amidotransferase subunit C